MKKNGSVRLDIVRDEFGITRLFRHSCDGGINALLLLIRSQLVKFSWHIVPLKSSHPVLIDVLIRVSNDPVCRTLKVSEHIAWKLDSSQSTMQRESTMT